MNTKELGNLGEIIATKRCMEKGFIVSFPYGDRARYDLLIDNGNNILKIQIKSCNPKNNILKCNLYSTQYDILKINKNNRSKKILYNKEQIDGFIVVNLESQKCYYVDIENINKSGTMHLRLISAKNNQNKNINLASDYEF